MGKAAKKSSTIAWISAWDALLLFRRCHPEHWAKVMLIRGLALKLVRYNPNNPDIDAVWRRLAGVSGDDDSRERVRIQFPKVHWEEGQVWVEYYVGGVHCHAYPIQVVQEDVLRLMSDASALSPDGAGSVVAPVSGESVDPVKYLRSRAKDLRAEDRIPDGMSRRKLAELLVDEMKRAKAAGVNIRLYSVDYLRNSLKRFGLWPISEIDQFEG